MTVGSVEAAHSPHLPVDPASDTVVVLTLWRAAVLGVDVTGPSLPVWPLVTTIINLLSTLGFTGYSLFLIKRHKVRATGPTQVMLVPRLITYLCYYLLDQNGNNTGCIETLFDQSPSLISQSLFCTQGTRTLTQVVLAYRVVSGTFCFPGITSSTVSPGLVFKYPGRAPKGTLFYGVHASCGRASRAGLSRGFCWLSRVCGLGSHIRTHSQREPWVFSGPRPMGSLTARVLVDGGSVPPWVSTLPSSFVSSCLG